MPQLKPMADARAPSLWTVYFEVADCDKTAENARKLGGETVTPPMRRSEPPTHTTAAPPTQLPLFALNSVRQFIVEQCWTTDAGAMLDERRRGWGPTDPHNCAVSGCACVGVARGEVAQTSDKSEARP